MIDRVIVTGAGGRLGLEIVSLFRREGIEVLPLVRVIDERSPRGSIAVDLTEGNWSSVRPWVRGGESLIHCAAEVPWQGPDWDTEARASMTRRIDQNVMLFAQREQCQLMYLSGCSLYDNRTTVEKDERAPLRGTTPYLRSKMIGEKLALEVPGSLVFRISNPVGDRVPDTTVMGSWIQSAAGGQTLNVWGTGSREQDFIAVKDVVAGILKTTESDFSGALNLASGNPVTMLELAATIVEVVGNGDVKVGARPDDRDRLTARFSNARARSIGWQPTLNLNDIIKHLLNNADTYR